MTQLKFIEFQPAHLLGIRVDPVVQALRGKGDLLTYGKVRKAGGVTLTLAWFPPGELLKIVACGGFVILWPGLAEMWLTVDIDTATLPGVPLKLHRQLDEWIAQHGLDRVQSTTPVEWETGARFLEFLGFKKECVMKKFGPRGIDQYLFARVR